MGGLIGVPPALPAPKQPNALPAPAAAPSVQPEGTPEFTFKDQKVRVTMIDGEPWFVAADVCRVLNSYVMAKGEVNTTMALLLLKPDGKTVPLNPIGGRKPNIISESGLYKLVMRSNKPEAKAFQKWVTREVLPSIRRTSSYCQPN